MVGEKYETYNHPHIVLYALNQSLIDDFEKLAAIHAYEEQKSYIQASKPQCDFLSLARSALIRMLIVDVGSMLDRDQYNRTKEPKENCSLEKLGSLIAKCRKNNETIYQEITARINDVYQLYYKGLCVKLRNTQLAHHDLAETFNLDTNLDAQSDAEIKSLLDDIAQLLDCIHDVLSKSFELTCGTTLSSSGNSFSKLVDKYNESLQSCIANKSNDIESYQ